MRRKKGLDSRLYACKGQLLGWLYNENDPKTHASEIAGGIANLQSPLALSDVYLEIGCGKGQFIREKALRESARNFLALEKDGNVLVTALESCGDLPNLRFIAGDALYLSRALPPCSVREIYLNFSCPFPKKRYTKHRLTHERFLRVYKEILADDGKIFLKTDSAEFFDFSLCSIAEFGGRFNLVTNDLHNSDVAGNIITEYEALFSSQGKKIHYFEAVL